MKKFALLLLVMVVANRLLASDSPEARSLFNGTNLAGWLPLHGGKFYVTNRVIRAEGGKGWLRTAESFTNFVLEVEWRGLETNYNSGLFVRAPLEGNPWATNVWLINTKQSAVGELLEGSKRIVQVQTPAIPAGEWIKFRIEARNRELTLDVNGQRAWKLSEFTPASGFIGLQAEGKTFEFRSLLVQPLP